MNSEEDKKAPIQFLTVNPKGIKKGDIVEKPIFVLDSKGKLISGLLKGYGERFVTIAPLARMKNYSLDREELIKQELKLYINPLDPNDVIIVSQRLSETIQTRAALSYKERKNITQ